MTRAPSYTDFARRHLRDAEADLIEQFGRPALEETAFSVYTNTFPPAAYLGWSRVVHAQRLLGDAPGHGVVLDFGPGLGVMLPFLSQRFDKVVALDVDPRPTRLMVERMGLRNVEVTDSLGDGDTGFDAVVALDVLEHVDDLHRIYADLSSRTALGGCWVISGPTENWLYKAMRKIARTTGEGHVRTIADVLDAVPPRMRPAKAVRLPFGSPVPLFVVARFEATT